MAMDKQINYIDSTAIRPGDNENYSNKPVASEVTKFKSSLILFCALLAKGHTQVSSIYTTDTDLVGSLKSDVVTTNNFNAHGNTIRIAIDYCDDHTKGTKNTSVFDNATIYYLECLFSVIVGTAASHEKRAQDKTTVRKSEFFVHSDVLSLSQTEQPDNVLAVAHSQFTYNALRRVIREDRPNDAWLAMEYVCDDPQSDANPRSGLGAMSTYRIAITGSVAPPTTTCYDTFYQAIRACIVGLNLQSIYQDIGHNKFGQVGCIVENDYAATGPTHQTKTTFDIPGRVNVMTVTNDTRAKTIFYDRLHRLTDAIVVGASTAAVRCDDLGAKANRISNLVLGDVRAYSYVTSKYGASEIRKIHFQKIHQFHSADSYIESEKNY